MGGVRNEEFRVSGKPRVDLRNLPAGHAAFLPGEEGRIEVQVKGNRVEDFLVEQVGSKIVLRTPEGLFNRWDSFDVTVRTPAGTELGVNVASADVDIELEAGALGINTASGDIRGQNVEGDVGVYTASGGVRFENVGGDLGVNTASGDIHVREVRGDVGVNTASGGLRVGTALAGLSFRSASGELDVGRYEGESLECNTQSGDVRVALPPGRTVELDLNTLSGDIRNDFPSDGGNGATARLRVRTLSGDITLARA